MIGAWEEQHIQPIRNKEKAKTDSDWSESFGQRQVKIVSLLMSTLAAFQRKCEMERVYFEVHKDCKGPLQIYERVLKIIKRPASYPPRPIQPYHFSPILCGETVPLNQRKLVFLV
jgi:hypothetical protein